MGKPPKKKGGKKDAPKEEPSQSTDTIEEPSTSKPPEVEADDDAGLTGAARKKREKKEKKEKALQALQALQASRKPSSHSECTPKIESEVPSEQSSRAQSETPSEPSVEAQPLCKAPADVPPEKPVEAAKAKSEPIAEEAEDVGLGLTGTVKKKKPRKKKTDAQPTQPTAGQQVSSPQEVQAVISELTALSISGSSQQVSSSVSSSGPAPLHMQMPEPVKAVPPAPWGRGPQSAGRGRGWAVNVGPPPGMPTPQLPPATPIPTPMPKPTPTPTPRQQPSTQTTSSQQQDNYPNRPPRSLEPVLCRYKIPTKIPGGLVRVRNMTVLVNYLEMQFKTLKISRYDVSFTPDRPKKMLPQIFAKVKAQFFPKDLIAFDQMKNCYSLHPLKIVPSSDRFHTNVDIIDQNGRTMHFEVSMKATGVVDLGNIRRYMDNRSSSICHPTEEVQCIDVILRQGALESYVKAGRQFFKRPLNPVDLGYGFEMWTGMFQSAIFTSKAFINVDVAHKGFPKHQTLLDALIKDFGLDPSRLVDNQRGGDYFASFVKGLKVNIRR